VKVIDLSLASDFKDFEDAVQCYSAVNAKVDCLITRNKRDYVTDILPILTPEEFLAAIAVECGAPERWARELMARGYVILIPDSFTTRGHAGGVCTNPAPSRTEVSPSRRVGDTYAALAHLRTLPHVDGSRVGLMGGSHGGSTTLASMVAAESDSDFLAREKRAGFAAAVALYPACTARYGSWRGRREAGSSGAITNYIGEYQPVAPLLILIGENDDWTPAEPCQKLTEAAQRAGYPVRIKIYPGAHHSFDSDRPTRYIGERVNMNYPHWARCNDRRGSQGVGRQHWRGRRVLREASQAEARLRSCRCLR
jgi:dienelactone hydrolase